MRAIAMTADAAARRMAERAAWVLRVAYVFPAYWMLTEALHWREYSTRQAPDLLWPVAWMTGLDPTVSGSALFVSCLIGVFMAGVLPHYRWARVLGACALTEYLALRFSLGKIHHLMHVWLLVSWVLCWLPQDWARTDALSRAQRQQVLRLFHACQLLLATTYTLSGTGKLLGAAYQYWRGQPTFLSSDALAKHTAARLLETVDQPALGEWVVRHGHWLWPGSLALLMLQLGAVWMARRPAFHVALGGGLVVFHAATTLVMGIDFTPAIMLCGVLFLASPFTATLPVCR